MRSQAVAGHVIADRYELVEPVARGPMGVVWRAFDRHGDRQVAIREVELPDVLDDGEQAVLAEKVLSEARAAARLTHSGAVRVLDAVNEGGFPFVVTELVEARSLEDVVEGEGPLPAARVAAIGIELLDVLGEAHTRGLVHRDVRPSNVLITGSGEVRLADFGIASMVDDPRVAASGSAPSPDYLAPEQTGTAAGASAGSDLWSLTATLYFAVEGVPPFAERDRASTIEAIVRHPFRPPKRAGRLLPLFYAVMVKDPLVRADEEQARAILARAAGSPPPEPAPVTDGRRATPAPGRSFEPLTPTVTVPDENVAETAKGSFLEPTREEDADAPAGEAAKTAPEEGTAAPPEDDLLFDYEPELDDADLAPAGAGASGAREARSPDDDVFDERVGEEAIVEGAAPEEPIFEGAVPEEHGPDEAGAELDRPEEGQPGGAESETTPEPWFFRVPAPVVPPPPVAEEPPAYVPEEPRRARRLPRGVWIGVLAVAVGLIMIALVTTGGRQVRPSRPTSQAANPGPVSAWVPYTDEATGFTLRYPPMWSVRRDASQTYFIDPATKSYLQVDHQEPPAPSPLGLWQDLEKRFVAQHPSYAKIQLADSTYQGFPAAVWEFTYSDGGVDVHAIDLGFSAGRYGFALLFQAPASEWARLQSAFESFKSVFRPPG